MRQKPLKFAISSAIALVWAALCTMLAVPWARASSIQLPSGYVLWVIVGIALLPGDLMCAMFFSNLFNAKMHAIATPCREPVSVLICARNEQNCIFQTIRQVVQQDYDGRIDLLCADNASSDGTRTEIQRAIRVLSSRRRSIRPGRHMRSMPGWQKYKRVILLPWMPIRCWTKRQFAKSCGVSPPAARVALPEICWLKTPPV